MIDLPAPVSPVMTLKPSLKSSVNIKLDVDIHDYVYEDAHVDVVRSRAAQSSIANDIVKDEYLSWLHDQRNTSLYEEPMVIYSAGCGLGHQLERLSAAYHLLMIYEIPHLQLHNRKCGLNEKGGETLIYDHLIGPGPLMVDIPAKFVPSDRDHLVRPHFWPEIKMANTLSCKIPGRFTSVGD